MIRSLKFLPALLLAAGCSDQAGTDPSAPQFARAFPEESVHGQIYIDAFDEKDTFTAVRLSDGTVRGKFDIHSGEVGHIHGDVICFTIVGNVAYLGGRITKAKDFPLLEGLGAQWTVQDNGEGSNDLPDLATDIRFDPSITIGDAERHCLLPRNLGFHPQARANIQIKH